MLNRRSSSYNIYKLLETRATLSCRFHFLLVSYLQLLRVLIGSMDCLRLFNLIGKSVNFGIGFTTLIENCCLQNFDHPKVKQWRRFSISGEFYKYYVRRSVSWSGDMLEFVKMKLTYPPLENPFFMNCKRSPLWLFKMVSFYTNHKWVFTSLLL